MRAIARAADRVQVEQIGGQRRAGERRIDALLVERVAGLVQRAEDRGRHEAAVVAGGDAHIVPGERNLEGVRRAVEPAAVQVVAELAGDLQGERALRILRVVAIQEVGASRVTAGSRCAATAGAGRP